VQALGTSWKKLIDDFSAAKENQSHAMGVDPAN